MKPFDTQTEAAVQKSSIDRAVAIVGDLQQRNYGIAETEAKILVHQLRHEEQERRGTEEAIHAAPKPDCKTCANKHIPIYDPPCRNCGAFENCKREEPDAFERQILGSVANIEKHDAKPTNENYGYYEGMKNAYRYTLAIYRRSYK